MPITYSIVYIVIAFHGFILLSHREMTKKVIKNFKWRIRNFCLKKVIWKD